MNARKITLIILALGLLAGGAWYYSTRSASPSGRTHRTMPVQRLDMDETVSASGTVTPVSTVIVGTQVSGTISRIHADYNSRVRRGQLIAEIDPSMFEARVAQSRANLEQAEANVLKAEADLAQAEREHKRSAELLAREIIPRSEFDKTETALLNSRAQVAVAKALVSQSNATLRLDETNLKYTRILSPVEGVVVSRNVSVGQTVAASFQTPTLFSIAEDLTRMQVEASVDEADIGKLRAGLVAFFQVDAYPEQTFRGTVQLVRLSPTTVENVVTYTVIIMVDNADLKLRPGMTATVSFLISSKKGVLSAPAAALRVTPPQALAGNKKYTSRGLWVVRGSGPEQRPVRVDVTTGITDADRVEILTGEVREGDEVVVEFSVSPDSNNKSGASSRSRGFF